MILPDSCTLTLKRLVVAALNEPMYTVAGELFVRPTPLNVLDHPVYIVPLISLPAIGVYPAMEEPFPTTASGVGDRQFTLELECVAPCGTLPPDDAVDQLRTWALVAIYNNAALRAAASRTIPSIGRSLWRAATVDSGDRPSVATVLQHVTLTHRTPYGNPTRQA